LGWTVTDIFPVAQMVAPPHGLVIDVLPEPVVVLGNSDAAEMMALAELTRPGPFLVSTVELGGYLGARHEGRLVAMAGRRLRVPGSIEISAVCTHPDHRGQGLSRLPMAAVDTAIRAEGHRAFLHVLHENISAVALYRRLGFTTRADTATRFRACDYRARGCSAVSHAGSMPSSSRFSALASR